MLLALIFTLLAAATLATVALPLLRPAHGIADRGQFDRAVYRDQLKELEREVARGVLSPAEAQSARLEIQRRLLAAEGRSVGSWSDAASSPFLAAGIAGFAGVLYGAAQQTVTPTDFSYVLSLAYVVVVLTTGVRTVEGAVQAGMAFAVLQQALTYLPRRFGGVELVLFAAGALTYARHPEGIVELQKTRWLRRVNRLLQVWDAHRADSPAPPSPAEMSGAAGG